MLTTIGDGPAIADAIGFKCPGNAYRPCRVCLIKGETAGQRPTSGHETYYVPHTTYNFASPPLRGDNDHQRHIIDLIARTTSATESKRIGINRASILRELRSLHFTRSFPIDIMHCVLLNIAGTLFRLWNGTKLGFEKESSAAALDDDYHLPKEAIGVISDTLATARTDIPADLCRAPRRIDKHYKGYKAAEWEAWIRYYGIPLLDQHLGDECVDNFRQLSRIFSLATQRSIKETELVTLDELTANFVRGYERLYYRGEPKRLPVCSVNIHYLVHLASHIRDCGPMRYCWQYPMERYCGIIKPMARSKSQLSTSLANGVITREHFNHIRFTRDRARAGEPDLECSYPNLLDSFVAASSSAHSKRSLSELLHGDPIDLEIYKRCQVDTELKVYSQRHTDMNRYDHRICYWDPVRNQMAFAMVCNFARAVCQNHRAHYLAYVHDYTGIDIDRIKRVASFSGEGRRRWIRIAWIESLFGILREGGVNLIITDANVFDCPGN
jgi:hypothetical protein